LIKCKAALNVEVVKNVYFAINRQEGSNIMRWAKEAGLTGKSYVWIATQSVIGESKEALPDFPAGMLGKIFFTLIQRFSN
jgi:hypothetical protein